MLSTLDIVLIGVMTVAAAITYTIKHRAELKLEEVRKIEAEIRLEHDTIDLLKADWALLTQPNRLQHLMSVYDGQLHLEPTDPTQMVQASELPKLKAELTPEEIEAGEKARLAAIAAKSEAAQVEIKDVIKAAEEAKAAEAAKKLAPKAETGKTIAAKPKKRPAVTDGIETGSVND